MKKTTKAVLSFFGCSAIGVFSGCVSSDKSAVNYNTNDSTAYQPPENVQEIVKNERLTIDLQKCIGCGKCSRIAPKNFAMKVGERKAEVISVEITSQRSVDRAVDVCPTNAITQ